MYLLLLCSSRTLRLTPSHISGFLLYFRGSLRYRLCVHEYVNVAQRSLGTCGQSNQGDSRECSKIHLVLSVLLCNQRLYFLITTRHVVH